MSAPHPAPQDAPETPTDLDDVARTDPSRADPPRTGPASSSALPVYWGDLSPRGTRTPAPSGP